MDELINDTWKQWKTAKSAAQSLCNKTARYDMAEKLDRPDGLPEFRCTQLPDPLPAI